MSEVFCSFIICSTNIEFLIKLSQENLTASNNELAYKEHLWELCNFGESISRGENESSSVERFLLEQDDDNRKTILTSILLLYNLMARLLTMNQMMIVFAIS